MEDRTVGTEAYRGYLIRENPLNGARWIEKDGHLIGHVHKDLSARAVRTLIDELTDETPKPEQPLYTDCDNCGTADHTDRLSCPCACHSKCVACGEHWPCSVAAQPKAYRAEVAAAHRRGGF